VKSNQTKTFGNWWELRSESQDEQSQTLGVLQGMTLEVRNRHWVDRRYDAAQLDPRDCWRAPSLFDFWGGRRRPDFHPGSHRLVPWALGRCHRNQLARLGLEDLGRAGALVVARVKVAGLGHGRGQLAETLQGIALAKLCSGDGG